MEPRKGPNATSNVGSANMDRMIPSQPPMGPMYAVVQMEPWGLLAEHYHQSSCLAMNPECSNTNMPDKTCLFVGLATVGKASWIPV